MRFCSLPRPIKIILLWKFMLMVTAGLVWDIMEN